ncbi:MAG: alpha/beta hydrolase [Kineosporiaceae bacterium]
MLQVLVPGIPFDRAYWDFQGSGGVYSYVDRASRVGVATLTLDRLGTGRSSRPPASAITIDAQAFVLEQVVAAVRGRTFAARGTDSRRFDRVVTTGFSVGSAVVLVHAARFHSVDGVIVTGFAHSFGPAISQFGSVVVPATADPVTAALNPPADYLTLSRQAQTLFGFTDATSTARVRAEAEAAKSTFVAAEGEGFAAVVADLALSSAVEVPVLAVLGREDALFCTRGCPEAVGESQAYRGSPSFRMVVVPDTAHNLNLHLTAPYTHAVMLRWLTADGT